MVLMEDVDDHLSLNIKLEKEKGEGRGRRARVEGRGRDYLFRKEVVSQGDVFSNSSHYKRDRRAIAERLAEDFVEVRHFINILS